MPLGGRIESKNAQSFPLAFVNGNPTPETLYSAFISIEPVKKETISVQVSTWMK